MKEYEQSAVWQGELHGGASADTSLGWIPSPERAAVRDLRDAVAAAVAPEPWWPPTPAHVGSRSAVDVGGRMSRWDQGPQQVEYQYVASRSAEDGRTGKCRCCGPVHGLPQGGGEGSASA